MCGSYYSVAQRQANTTHTRSSGYNTHTIHVITAECVRKRLRFFDVALVAYVFAVRYLSTLQSSLEYLVFLFWLFLYSGALKSTESQLQD